MICENCAYYTYDEDEADFFCDVCMDEDDVYRLENEQYKSCPYFRDSDEYAVVRHQI